MTNASSNINALTTPADGSGGHLNDHNNIKSALDIHEQAINSLQVSGGNTGATAITVKNQGNVITTSASSIDFTGSGISAGNNGNAVTVLVSGNNTGNNVGLPNGAVWVYATTFDPGATPPYIWIDISSNPPNMYYVVGIADTLVYNKYIGAFGGAAFGALIF